MHVMLISSSPTVSLSDGAEKKIYDVKCMKAGEEIEQREKVRVQLSYDERDERETRENGFVRPCKQKKISTPSSPDSQSLSCNGQSNERVRLSCCWYLDSCARDDCVDDERRIMRA